MATINVPNIVALGIVTSGFSIFSAGIDPLSNPINAYKVIAATTGKVAKSPLPVKLKSGKLLMSK